MVRRISAIGFFLCILSLFAVPFMWSAPLVGAQFFSGEDEAIDAARGGRSQFVGDEGPAGLVPCGDDMNGNGRIDPEEQCGLCHLGELAQDSLNFAVYATVFVATLMFVYAGFQYITAGGDSGKITAATRVFGKVVIGLIVVLLSWLIVNTILNAFLSDNVIPWNQIECSSRTATSQSNQSRDDTRSRAGNSSIAPDGGGVSVIPSRPSFPAGYVIDDRTHVQKAEEEDSLREVFRELCQEGDHCSIDVNRSACAPNTATTDTNRCTDITRLHVDLHNVIDQAAHECGNLANSSFGGSSSCKVLITGGSELGAHGTRSGCGSVATTHCSGNKVDISAKVATLNNYVLNDNHFSDGTCPDGRSGRVHRGNGSCWVNEGTHWDVTRGGL